LRKVGIIHEKKGKTVAVDLRDATEVHAATVATLSGVAPALTASRLQGQECRLCGEDLHLSREVDRTAIRASRRVAPALSTASVLVQGQESHTVGVHVRNAGQRDRAAIASLATQTPARDGPSILVESDKGRLSGDDLGSATDIQGSSSKGGTLTTSSRR